MRILRRVLAAAATTLAALVMVIGPASADSPVTITDTVTDPSGFLSSSQIDAIKQSASTAAEKGVDFYFVAVPDLSGQDGTTWCQAAGLGSGLSNTSIVYVIAYEERQQTWCGNQGEKVVSDSQLTKAKTAAGTVLGKSNPLDGATTADAVTTFVSTMTGSSGSGKSLGSAIVPLVLVIIVVLIAGQVVVSMRRRKKLRSTVSASSTGLSPAQRIDLANRRLLEADERVRSASDELDYARAQFGTLRTDDYAMALDAARSGVAHAFELQQTMNGTDPEAARTVAADQILSTLDSVMNPLATQQATFHDLRDSEAGADEQLAALRERISEVTNSIPAAETELHTLTVSNPAATISSLQDNPDQARALLDSATQAANQAEQALPTDRSRAVEAIDTGQRALAMARLQLEAIMTAQKDLADASSKLTEATASITSDLNDVTRLGADPTAFASLIQDAHAAITAARTARDGQGDPLEALEALHSAETALDLALAGLRSADEQRTRASAGARNKLSVAQTWVRDAQTWVQSRRGLISLDARSRVSQAETALAEATRTVDSDPQASMQSSDTASSLARSVMQSGQQDPPLGQQTRIGSSVGDALLWSVLLGSLGGHHGSSWGDGGPSRGGFGGGGFGGGGGGGFGGGGFGGGGTSSF